MHTDDPSLAHSDALATRFTQGCQHAFAALYRLHAAKLTRQAYGWARQCEQDAQDIVHDAFLSAWKARESLREPSRFCAWIGQIALRLAFRKRRTLQSEDALTSVVDENPDALALLIHKREWMRLRGAITHLSPRQRHVVQLRTEQSMPFRDIASRLECSDVAARVNYRHGVRALQQLMVS